MSTFKRGRPSVSPGEPSIALTLTISERLYDSLRLHAVEHRTTVLDLLRLGAVLALNKKLENRHD